jgi:hypothetical protein
MQHQFGKPLHRSTEWRRNKSGGDGRRGRRWTSESRDKGFLGFAATVISLINKNGSVGYGELEKHNGGWNRSYWKDKTTDKTFAKLAHSGFPPAMLAVAACIIGKLNKKTRRGAKPIKLMPHEQAFRKLKESGMEITVKNYETALRREKFEVVLKQAHTTKADRERYMVEAEKSEFRDKWVIDYLMKYQTPSDKRAYDLAPTAASSKSTPAHQIDFLNGAELSRKMVYYWKHHARFPDCVRFIGDLLTEERPSVPSDNFYQMPYDYYMNGEIQMWAKVRQMERALSGRDVDIERVKNGMPCPACHGGRFVRCPNCHHEVGKVEITICPECRKNDFAECYNSEHPNREKEIKTIFHVIMEVVNDEETGKPINRMVNCEICKNRRILKCVTCNGTGHVEMPPR